MFEIDKQKFGVFVAMLRKEKGLTQKELAKLLYISDKAVSKWETGVSIPDTALLVPMADLFGIGNGALNVPAYGAGWHYGYGPGGKCGENGYFLF